MRLFGFFDDGDDDDRSRSSSSSSCSSSSSSDDSNIGGNTGNHFLSEIHDFDHLNMADFLLDLGILDDLFGILEPFEDDEEEESYDSDFSEQEKEDMRGRGPRKKRKKRDPYNAPFYNTYIKPADQHGPDVADSIWDETSGLAKSFRQRFGLPWIHFNNIYEDWNRDPDGEYRADKSRNGTPRIDARILMMGTFAILTQDMTFDWMDLVSDTSKSINHRFFHKFIWWFKNHYLEEWIRFPDDEASLKKVREHC